MEQKENRVVLRGTVAGEAVLSHQVHGIDFYRFPLAVPRLSGREDLLNILFPLSSPETALPQAGAFVEVTGEIRSFNNRSGVGNRLVITVLARSVVPGEGDPCNQVFLHGVLCKPPVLRRTPLGRDICDLLLAVNRRYRRADYLPCIAWAAWLCSAASFRQGMPSGWTDGCRAAPTSKPSGRPPRSAPRLKSPSPAWRFQRSCPRKPICCKPEAS